MSEFRYVRISESFVTELGDLVSQGESLVLLGPRNIGKRYLIRRLVDSLAPTAAGRVGLVSFLTSIPDEEEVQANAASGTVPGLTRLEPKPSAVLRWVDERLGAGEGRVTLCAANVDALPYSEIQGFLSGLRDRVEDRGSGKSRLTVVFTGEVDLGRFVAGPRSSFTCGNQFVIQGFARAEFLAFAGRYVSLLGPIIKPLDDDMIGELYDRTGGNTYLLRLVLWSIFDHHASTAGPTFHPVSITCLPAEIVQSQPPWTYYLHSMTRLIDGDRGCWRDLERLLAGREIPVGNGAPHVLELAGVAVREDGRLTMPETLVRDYVQQRYTLRRFADLYVREAAWSKAFRRYDRLAPSERCRPSSIEDVADAEEAVKHLSTSLYRKATRGPDAVLRLFGDGCRYIMGFPEVTRWRLTDAGWEPIREPLRGSRKEPTFDQPDPNCVGEYRALLAGISPKGSFGLVTVDPAQQSCLLVVRVPTSHPDLHEVIIVGRPWARNILSRTREQMSVRLIHDFLAAHNHAWDDRHADNRAEFQKKFTEIASEVVKRLGTEIREMEGVLKLAAALLRTKLHYKRVCISVIDPKRVTTVPVVLDADPGLPGIEDLQPYRYRFDDERPSATIWTIKQKHPLPLVMHDATTDTRANNAAAAKLGIKAVALIPLVDPQNLVVGIVQIERADGRVPTPTEVDALFDFGKKLAVALQLNEQIVMLQSALDTLPQAIAIFDRAGRTRYLNKLAMHFLDFLKREAKWYPAGTGPSYDELAGPGDDREWLATFVPLLRETFADREPHSDRTDVTIRGELYHLDAMVKPIWDWRQKLPAAQQVDTDLMAGALFHSQDVTYLSRAFQALEELITASGTDKVIEKTIKAVRRLEHRWCRLYVLNPVNPSELVSKMCFGSEPDVQQWQDKFNSGGYVIPRYDNSDLRWEGWECLKKRRPLVLFYDPTRDDRELVKNKYGLEAVNCRDQKCPPELKKKEGEYWIDFPLFTAERVFGKLTLQWDSWRSPEDERTLSRLCELTSMLLEEAVHRENYAQEALHWVLHDIKTPPAQLLHTAVRQHQLIDQLRRKLAKGRLLPASSEVFKDLKDLEDTVVTSGKICDEIVGQIEKEEKEFQVFPNRTRTDLAGLIRGMLPIENDRYRVELDAAPAEFVMDLDGNGFKKVLRGLFDNAGRFPRESIPVRVTVSVRQFEREGKPWVRVAVEDNGEGVPLANKRRIFEKGFSTNPSDTNKGWGFGLYKARKLIEDHGGTIDEEGTEWVRARFVIELPQYQRP
jgi:signal transduction histidine kinase/PAS domain-containing protein